MITRDQIVDELLVIRRLMESADFNQERFNDEAAEAKRHIYSLAKWMGTMPDAKVKETLSVVLPSVSHNWADALGLKKLRKDLARVGYLLP